jgi:molecular chaperone GrpE
MSDDDRRTNPSTAGPVAGEDPPPSQAAGGGPTPTPPAEEEQMEHDLNALLSERDDYLELAKRTKADFENYRRRMTAEVQAASARGKAALVGELVHVIDNLFCEVVGVGIDCMD